MLTADGSRLMALTLCPTDCFRKAGAQFVPQPRLYVLDRSGPVDQRDTLLVSRQRTVACRDPFVEVVARALDAIGRLSRRRAPRHAHVAGHVEEKDPADLYRMAITGLLDELGDPHTTFMTPDEYEGLRIQTTGEYGGLGIQIGVRNDWVTVIAPLPETPAERAGLQAGDRIVKVDGESTRGWDEDEAVSRLRGPNGSRVTIEVARIGVEEPIPFTIVREEIHVQSVRNSFMLEPGIGYVSLTVFSETSTQEVRTAIDNLRRQGMRGVVLDLRTNPGGLLDQAITLSEMFLDRGEQISEVRARDPRDNQAFRDRTPDSYPEMPIVVLVNGYSA